MWEFSINLSSSKSNLAASIFNVLREQLSQFKAIVARSDSAKFINIVIAVPAQHRADAEIVLLKTITLAICNTFKQEFLDRHLFLPKQDEIGITAFKKALINFDKETDYFLISKALNFNEFLYLESFYQFKLVRLREKWSELVCLANQNRDYLISTEAFNDLLKFLIDNLDICKDEIDVFEEDDGRYCICDDGKKCEILGDSAMVSSLIDLSPQKINFYYKNQNHATELLKIIFDRRLNLRSSKIMREQNISNISHLHR